MKHTKVVSKAPSVAQTALELKTEFLIDMIDLGLTFVFQKDTRL